jgi:hypothetical protein
MYLSRTY